jgi:hypothetical protein
MVERDSENQIRPSDRVALRRTVADSNGGYVVEEQTLMRLPQWRGRFGSPRTPSPLLPEGISVLDTTHITARDEEGPRVTIAGETIGSTRDERKIQMQNGQGTIELEEGVEVVVEATHLTQKYSRIRW